MSTLLRLVLMVLPLLALPLPATAAWDCGGTTPLPDGVRLVPAAADVPADVARFAGAWSGAWTDTRGDETLCHALVVEEVFANGWARVVYGHGTYAGRNIRMPNGWRATGRVSEGVLRFRSPLPGGSRFAYRFDDGQLTGRVDPGGETTLTRVADVAALDCGRAERARPAAPAGGRDRLTAAELLAPGSAARGPVHTDYFVAIGAAGPAKHALRGTITVPAFALRGAKRGCPGLPTPIPAATIPFFTYGEHLVPAVRELIQRGGMLLLSPGRVWSEPGDGGLSRASFPFVLTNHVHNGALNGLATFVFDATRVSDLRLQIGQETSAWGKEDYWAQVPMTYAPGPAASEDARRAEFTEELRRQTPIRPWSALPASAALADFDGDAAPEDISANGLVLDGVLYLRGCHTRHGPFPYCREMRHGVFSVTKSMAAAVALLRLARKYGDGVLDEKLTDYLPAGAAHPGWAGVTFADALNMATGIGDERPEREPNSPFADENRPKMLRWIGKRTAKEKLEIALGYGKYPWGRGEVLRYNSTQTFVLAVAMDTYLKRREGPDAHLWDMVRNEVLRPIGILHAPAMHTLERDGSRGVPLLGYGLYPTADDVAKLTRLLQDGGRYGGVQLLSAGKLTEALYRARPMVGLPLGFRNRFGAALYHLSFWSVPYRTNTGCFFQIPYMNGYGGNLVGLLPNGVSVFRFADGFNFDLDSMIVAGESLRPFCTAPASVPPATPPRAALDAAELRTLLPGHTLTIGRQRIAYAPDGRLYGSIDEDVDVGTWEITPDGRSCRRWNVWDNGRARCYRVFRDGERLELQVEGRFGAFVGTRTPGTTIP